MNAAWTTLPLTSITRASAGIAVDPRGPDRLDDAAAHDHDAGVDHLPGRNDHARARQGVGEAVGCRGGLAAESGQCEEDEEQDSRVARRMKFSMSARDSICFAVAGRPERAGRRSDAGTGGHDDSQGMHSRDFAGARGRGHRVGPGQEAAFAGRHRGGDGRRHVGRAGQGRRAHVLRRQVDRGDVQPPDAFAAARTSSARARTTARPSAADAPVWRAGANATTKLKTEVPLMIGGKTLAPGSYDIFVELKEGGVDADPLDAADARTSTTRTTRRAIWGSYGLRPEVRRRARADDDGHARGFDRAVHDRLRGHDGRPAASSRWSGRRRPASFRSRSQVADRERPELNPSGALTPPLGRGAEGARPSRVG